MSLRDDGLSPNPQRFRVRLEAPDRKLKPFLCFPAEGRKVMTSVEIHADSDVRMLLLHLHSLNTVCDVSCMNRGPACGGGKLQSTVTEEKFVFLSLL